MHNPETRKKISLSKMGDKNPAKRPEVRKKISDTLTTRVDRACLNCGNFYYPVEKERKFCSVSCYYTYRKFHPELYKSLNPLKCKGDENYMSYKRIMDRNNCDLEEAKSIRKRILYGDVNGSPIG